MKAFVFFSFSHVLAHACLCEQNCRCLLDSSAVIDILHESAQCKKHTLSHTFKHTHSSVKESSHLCKYSDNLCAHSASFTVGHSWCRIVTLQRCRFLSRGSLHSAWSSKEGWHLVLFSLQTLPKWLEMFRWRGSRCWIVRGQCLLSMTDNIIHPLITHVINISYNSLVVQEFHSHGLTKWQPLWWRTGCFLIFRFLSFTLICRYSSCEWNRYTADLPVGY